MSSETSLVAWILITKLFATKTSHLTVFSALIFPAGGVVGGGGLGGLVRLSNE